VCVHADSACACADVAASQHAPCNMLQDIQSCALSLVHKQRCSGASVLIDCLLSILQYWLQPCVVHLQLCMECIFTTGPDCIPPPAACRLLLSRVRPCTHSPPCQHTHPHACSPCTPVHDAYHLLHTHRPITPHHLVLPAASFLLPLLPRSFFLALPPGLLPLRRSPSHCDN
jgi:hypothetical protein